MLLWSQVLVRKLEGSCAVDGVEALEELDCGAVRDAGAGVEAANFRKFIGYPLVHAYCVVVAPLRHERLRGNQADHFRVVVGVGEIEFAISYFFVKT